MTNTYERKRVRDMKVGDIFLVEYGCYDHWVQARVDKITECGINNQCRTINFTIIYVNQECEQLFIADNYEKVKVA